MMFLLPQHDAHVIARRLENAAAFGRRQADETIRFVEETWGATRANVEHMSKSTSEAFIVSEVIWAPVFRHSALRVGVASVPKRPF